MTLLLAQLMASSFSPSSHQLTPNLFIYSLQGIYLLSTIVQLRSSFPPPTPTPILDSSATTPTTSDSGLTTTTTTTITPTTNLFSTIPAFEVFGSLFDWSFLVAAAGTVVGRWSFERVDGVGDD